MSPEPSWRALESFSFGDGPELADELLDLMLAGRKTATCWDAREGAKGTEIGKAMVVKDSQGRPRAVIRTVDFYQRQFDDVDAVFAYQEGEDDRSLFAWRRAHTDYFTRNGGFAPDMLLNCERFELIQVIGEDQDP